MAASVSWFELPADDPKALVEFYRSAFGWTADPFPGTEYFLLDTHANGSGITGAVTKRGDLRAPAATLYVESIDRALEAVTANGGRLVSDKQSIPDIGTFAYAADPEGNVFGILQQTHPA